MIAIVDYGAGNLFSVKNACDFLNIETVATADVNVIKQADAIILPGVGALPDAMKMLREKGLVEVLKEQATQKPLLGICLGMQMLFEYGTEFEKTEGLGLLEGYVDLLKTDYKLPQMGWNSLNITQQSPLLEGVSTGDYVYFVHSYGAVCPSHQLLATCDYGTTVTAIVGKGNVYGAQFHPEKSGEVGLKILENFGKLVTDK